MVAHRLTRKVPFQLPLGVWIVLTTLTLSLLTWLAYQGIQSHNATNGLIAQRHKDQVTTNNDLKAAVANDQAQISSLACLAAAAYPPGEIPFVDQLRTRYHCPDYTAPSPGVTLTPSGTPSNLPRTPQPGGGSPTPAVPAPAAPAPRPASSAVKPSATPTGIVPSLLCTVLCP